MSYESTSKGWVVMHKDGTISEFSFKATRSASIKRWLSIWSKPNWRKYKREGYKCVKAVMTIKTQE